MLNVHAVQAFKIEVISPWYVPLIAQNGQGTSKVVQQGGKPLFKLLGNLGNPE